LFSAVIACSVQLLKGLHPLNRSISSRSKLQFNQVRFRLSHILLMAFKVSLLQHIKQLDYSV